MPPRSPSFVPTTVVAVLIVLALFALPQSGFLSIVTTTMGSQVNKFAEPVVMAEEALMCQKTHGTCANPPQLPLRWGVDAELTDRICCFNRHYAEHSGYFTEIESYMSDLAKSPGPIEYYDPVSRKLLFRAPVGRSMSEFIKESRAHGWPSFRDAEVEWANVRVLPNGETVSVDGTHLGHNLPDRKGNRYCINLVSVSGQPTTGSS